MSLVLGVRFAGQLASNDNVPIGMNGQASNVVCVFPVMSLFVCLSAVQHGYVGQEVHNLIRNQNKNVTTAIVATVTIYPI